ncbi:MAG TPA: chemotaxis protein CheB, partial [Polyangiaceae bacterium]
MRKRDAKSTSKRRAANAKPKAQSKPSVASPGRAKPTVNSRTATRDRRAVALRPTQLRRTKTSTPDRDAGSVASKPLLPVVGIGASAGGLEALEQFFAHVPGNSDIAWVVIQHLDPTHEAALVELLQRVTKIPVLQAKNNLPVEANHVYVIPPNRDMSIREGRLKLVPQPLPRGLNLPIDCFFRSLASDKQDRSIGVVLSGMGSDGTLGLREIKANAGAAFVQAPDTAKFDGMPRSAIDAGLADVIAAADELPEKIIEYARQTPQVGRLQLLEDQAQNCLDKIYALLRTQTGNDFTLYKKSTIHRRIERRMGLHQIDGAAAYVRFLRENPREVELLFKELLIGVTSFFRDASAWAKLASQAIPALLATRAGGVIRAWVPGCSTGEEAYSLAITFKEVLEKASTLQHVSLQIFATDLDRDAIERARHGVFAESIAADVSPA